MLAYANYRRNTHQGAAWERYWYVDSGDYYLGTGMPESISAGPTLDLTGHMSRAFVLAADPEAHKKAAADPDLKRLNELLAKKEQDRATRIEITDLREKLDQRYPQPSFEPGQTVYAAEDDEYTREAWEMQTGGDYGIGVAHTVPKTMLAAIFTNKAAAKSFSYQGAHSYEVTQDPAVRNPKAQLGAFVDGVFAKLRR